ncbi:hypothetical protein BKA65DRAFT_554262 [Rhexocercosporidium sp. MPI-PUGE-AT-0058]|nr:hypothetical protein BKA65DRAFT_554262 [Rhexocercosporidium sp. MPI-PUGE-AT-0058]
MASPPHVTIHNLTGHWELNRELSDNLSGALLIQGVPYLIRKLMLYVKVYETITETPSSTGHGPAKGLICTKSAAGLKGQADAFDGSGEEVLVAGGYFAPTVRVRSWWVDLASTSEKGMKTVQKSPVGEVLDPYLLTEWIEEEKEGVPGHFAGSGVNERSGVRDFMMWGFTMIGGKRYRALKYYITKGNEEVRTRLVYDWVGGL